jgi:hypothetical protein
MGTMVNTISAQDYFGGGDVALMETDSPLSNYAIARTFRAAVLLTGGVRQAEAAMLDAIEGTETEEVSDQTFLLNSVRASIARGRQSKATSADGAEASSILAPELKRILLLKPHLRQALVLRVLLGFSDDDCARLSVRNAGQRACAAVQELARIREVERIA